MKKIIATLLCAALLVAFAAPAVALGAAEASAMEKKLSELKMPVLQTVSFPDAPHIVFVSATDGGKRAQVVQGAGKTRLEAWEDACAKAARLDVDARWLRVDVVTSWRAVSPEQLNAMVEGTLYDYFFRKGVSFGEVALLETELNANGIIDYARDGIDLARLNAYLTAARKAAPLGALPEDLAIFDTKGFFIGEDGRVLPLSDSEANYGLREFELTRDSVGRLLGQSSRFLASLSQKDGRFIYGYDALTGETLKGYNIVRHAATIWSMVLCYGVAGDESVLAACRRGIDYLIKNGVAAKGDAAYVYGDKQATAGGNGLAIMALTEYMKQTGSNSYAAVAKKLGNGILALQKGDGAFTQVLHYPSMRVKTEFLTVFYDGEAALALASLYGFTREAKYLAGAKKACDYFIEKGYEKEGSHWMAYCFNELSKYDGAERYLEFLARNVKGNLATVRSAKAHSHTSMEFLMASYEQYHRAVMAGKTVQLNGAELSEAVREKAALHVNAFMFPEMAMYFAQPDKAVGGFAVRSDGFRTRIDDVQHFIGGYYLLYRNAAGLVG